MNSKQLSIESLLVMLLFLVFTIAMGLLIFSGHKSYGGIIEAKQENRQLRTVTAYLRTKVKQNDAHQALAVEFNDVYQVDCLVVYHRGEENGYKTVIFCHEGNLYEAYLEEKESVNVELSEKMLETDFKTINFIIEAHALQVSYERNNQWINQTIAFHSGENLE